MSMPIKAIDRLFRRLAATYGAAWDRSLGTAPIEDVKAAWAHELSGFSGRLDDLAWALENLPERCPNVIEFRTLARSAPAPKAARLEPPPPQAMPQQVAAALERMRAEPGDDHDRRNWARRILARRKAGEKVSPTAVEMARAALGKPRREPEMEAA